MKTIRVPPHDAAAEIAVLGAMLLDPAEAARIVARLEPADFFCGSNSVVFRALRDLIREHGTADVVLLRSVLAGRGVPTTVGAASFLARLMAEVPTAANAEHYARILTEQSNRRRLLAVSQQVGRDAADPALTSIQAAEAARAELDAIVARGGAGGWLTRGIHTADNILFTDPPADPEWLVEDALLYRGGVSLLTAAWKVGKTFAALGLALDLVARIEEPNRSAEFLGSRVVGRGPVLYLSAEGGRAMLLPRLERMGTFLGMRLRDLHVWTGEHGKGARTLTRRPNLASPADVRDVFRWARDVGAVLVVFDPLLRFWRFDRDRMAESADAMLDTVQEEAERANCGVLLPHHETKASGLDDAGVSSGRESGRLGDDVSCAVINLKVDRERTQTTAHFVCRHGPSIEKRELRFDTDTLRFEVDGAPQGARRGPAPTLSVEEVFEAIPANGAWIDRSKLVRRLGGSDATVRRRLQELLEQRGDEVEYDQRGGRQGEARIRRRAADAPGVA